MATTAPTFQFTVTNLSLFTPIVGGDQYAQVTFSKQQDPNAANVGGVNSLTLTVPVAESSEYQVGKVYDMTLKVVA